MKPRPDSRAGRFLASRWGADGLLWVTVCASVVFLDNAQPLRFGLSPVAADVLAVAALTGAVAVWRRLPVVAAAVPSALSFALNPDLFYENLLLAQLVLAFLLGRHTRRTRTGLLLWVGICVIALLVAAVAPEHGWVDGQRACSSAVLTVLLPWLVGRYLRQRDELIRTGWELADRMARERDLAGQRARMRERSRIASDIHDSVGHELSLIALRAAAIEVDPAAGAAARQAAAELRETAAHATNRLHDVIGVLREDSDAIPVLPADDTLAALLERANASGMPITVTGELPPLSPSVTRAAYRVVQEALTNAAKHAPGVPVTVNLGAEPTAGEAVVTVANACLRRPTVRPAWRFRPGQPGRAGPDHRRSAERPAYGWALHGDRPVAVGASWGLGSPAEPGPAGTHAAQPDRGGDKRQRDHPQRLDAGSTYSRPRTAPPRSH